MESAQDSSGLEEFLCLIGQASRRPGADGGLEAVAGWLRRRLGVEMALRDHTGATLLSTPGFPGHVLPLVEPTLARLAGGQLASAAMDTGAFRILMEAVAVRPPRPVLLVAGAEEPAPRTMALASHAASVVAALYRARETVRVSAAYQRKAHQMRLALFMALMAGDTTLARRMTASAVPALLEARRLRVCLLRCPPGERDRIAQAHQDPSGYHGRGLMVRCPVYDEHLICLVAEDQDDAPNAGGPGLTAVLRDLADDPGYLLGISRPHPLAATAQAYEQARHALGAARHAAGRVAVFQGEASLERVLPGEAARRWARRLLRPLDGLPPITVDVLRLAMQFPRSGVARLLGIGRNTVTAHLRRAEQALGLDLEDVGSRAALALALGLAAPGTGEPEDPPAPPVAAGEMLGDAARRWAEEFLRPLEEHAHRHDLHATLRAWIEAGTDAQRAAHSLGISRNTVRAHLLTAQRLLQRDLLPSGPGVHELVHALHLTGRIAPPAPLR
ncbi:helix-turn-helix domain-containing protein [Sphaerisporangium sp. TRM90804]|uniref:helix-turn-helix domain-containing protein n=1 Tax=Sphaerisporangium sp. TRM90804 TaxID=3031113 RepID=UPI00244CFEAB|nr:helix-turn-helix domain-containing protein [Sphaerisporangium sp. TRM90804]MDH2425947.1 helix-turn-helix domain-containing protein [Sphaerisporangium sp. TRM90804]